MSTTMNIAAAEHGVLRLFSINLQADEIKDFTNETAAQWPLKDALGAQHLDPDFVEVITLADLADFTLSRYLMDGNGIPEDQITPLKSRLDALTGHALLVTSSALSDTAQTLTPKAPLVHIATFFEEAAPVTFDPLPDESAQRQTPEEKPRKQLSDAAIGGRVATLALLVAFGVAAMMVWLA